MFARSSKIRIGRSRPSFTLVELLVAIAIIGIMAGMVLYTLAGAQQDALRARTRGTIDKINQVILERWEGYRYRSVKLPVTSQMLQQKQIKARGVARLRSLFLKDMMRMELPDNFVDLAYTPTGLELTGPPDLYPGVPPMTFGSSPGREYNVLRNYFQVGRPILESDPAGAAALVANTTQVWTTQYQASECLYAIVAHSTSGGGSALEGFVASEIGDVDGDGFPEFIDAWGEPIGWIRWPAGYDSALNRSYKATPDAFDPLRTAFQWSDASYIQKPWTVVPLIVSAGADREFGINQPENIFATSRNVFIGGTDTPTVGLISNADQTIDNVSNHDILLE